MHRIERIEPILCHLAMDEPACSIVTGNHEASQQSTDYPIVHHQRKGTEQLRLSTGGKRRIADISQQVEYHPSSESLATHSPHPTKWRNQL